MPTDQPRDPHCLGGSCPPSGRAPVRGRDASPDPFPALWRQEDLDRVERALWWLRLGCGLALGTLALALMGAWAVLGAG